MHSPSTLHASWGAHGADRELIAIETRIRRQRHALLDMTTQSEDCENLEPALQRILETASRTLNVARVSIWRYNPSATAIQCQDLFDADHQRHECGLVLEAKDYPKYFAALATATIIAADEAVSDPLTAEFADGYLRPAHITSMMDVPIYQKKVVTGVLCHEHIGAPRHWTDDEKAFAISVANLISLAFERCDRFRAESARMLQSAALNAAADAMVITDRRGTIVWANPAFSTVTGYSVDEAVGRNPRDLLSSGLHDQEFFRRMWVTLLGGEVWRGEITNRRKDGTTYVEQQTITPVRNGADGRVSHFVAIKRDLTEQRLLAHQFLQAQKMEVVGRLAGGIAHDFNNMLTVIGGTAELILSDVPSDHPLRADVSRIQEASTRAASLTRQLLTFSRKQISVVKPVSIARLLGEFRGFLQRLIGEDIELDITSDTGDAQVMADPSQLEQIILNLAVNARDAMPKGGSLRIRAVLEPAAGGPSNAQHVKLTVADSGIGIPPEIQARIFEPFFTTKEAGKGTGLGLATVASVVDQLRGTVSVASTEGQGTTFTILVPAMESAADYRPAAAPALQRGTGNVLLVEDEDPVRELARRILENAGYNVITASQPDEAIELVRRQDVHIDLLITDVVLPGGGGREFANAVTAIRPGLPVLYTSGYTDDTVLAHGIAQQEVAFLPKPYRPASLRAKVREVLASAGAAA